MRITDQRKAVEAIWNVIERTDATGVAPFAVIVGAGFSHGLVPTAREVVAEHLPAWIDERANYRALVQSRGPKLAEVASNFWRRFSKNNKLEKVLRLDLRTGVPTNYVAAYQAAFNVNYSDAIGTLRDSRAFQRALIRVDSTRLNAAHFLLASILAAQPGRTKPGPLFHTKAAFCRLIVTTNFDPFLQVALQRVNQLYLMHDTPHLGIDADFAGDETDAIQIVYLHGSIHRRSQTATEEQIAEIKALNSAPLAQAFRSRGVIVLGYAGWDDGIVQALVDAQAFECGLFWCGREDDPLASGALPRAVVKLLNRRDCAYVRIRSAGAFMAALSAKLTRSPPLLLDKPIEQLLENLRGLQLDDLAQLEDVDPRGAGSPLWRPPANGDVFEQARTETLNLLTDAERLFQSATLFKARLAEKLGHLEEAIARCNEALASGSAVADMVPILMLRAHARWASSLYLQAADDFEQLLDLNKLKPEEKVEVLFNLAATRRDGREYLLALDVLQRVVDGSFSTDCTARARYMRGVVFGDHQQQPAQAVEENTFVVDLPSVSESWQMRARLNRGYYRSRNGDHKGALSDYDSVVAGTKNRAEQARALHLRGRLRMREENPQGFLDDVNALLALDPNDATAKFDLGIALLATDSEQDAIAAYRDALKTTRDRETQNTAILSLLFAPRSSWTEQQLDRIRALFDADAWPGEEAIELVKKATLSGDLTW